MEFDFNLRQTVYWVDSAFISLSWVYDMQGTSAYMNWLTLGYAGTRAQTRAQARTQAWAMTQTWAQCW